MKIISIDPGYERLGIAIIEKSKNQKETLVFSECFKTSSKLPHNERLALIGDRISEIIKKHKPEQLATEKLFFAGNQKTALLVSEARGVILYTCTEKGLDVFEYRPNEIKIAITGYGAAQKKQMMDMTRKLIKIDSKINSDDEMDAIAIGLTHLAINRL